MINTMLIEPKQKAKACVIWMHGLGANADDMAGLAKQLPLNTPVRHVALNAPTRPVTLNQGMLMPAWYDITGMSLTDREDEAGILASEQNILEVINTQIADGFSPKAIFLAGFSQGGAMALFTALRTELALGGVLALSAYLPLAAQCQALLDRKTPMFIASGTLDQVVLPAWTLKSVAWLQARGFNALTVENYPMGHAVCIEEMQALTIWIETHVGEV
jgi:phospholipase/carboxylesterase